MPVPATLRGQTASAVWASPVMACRTACALGAPVTVVVGDEELLVERAVSAIVAARPGRRVEAAHPADAEGTDVHDVPPRA